MMATLKRWRQQLAASQARVVPPRVVLPRPLELLGAILVTLIVAAEFGTVLEQQRLLLAAVTALDIVLVGAFLVYVGVGALRARRARALAAWMIARRVDLLLLAICIGTVWFEPRAAVIPIVMRIVVDVVSRAIARGRERRTAGAPALRPARALALSFIGLITGCALLLILPAATVDGQGATLTDAFFTASSATSVTGLVVQDTGSYWTNFGLIVILVTIQVGAIGIMVLAAAFAVLVGGRLPGSQQEGLSEAGFGDLVNLSTIDGLKQLTVSVTGLTLAIEGVGALVIYAMWAVGWLELREAYDSWDTALWWSVFHSISAFCHAGFSLEPDSLVAWRDHYVFNIVMILLITLGAVGFPVLADLLPRRGRKMAASRGLHGVWHRFHMQTKVVLLMTLVLNVIGMIAYLYFEYDRSLDGLSVPSKVMAALFQSVSTRSAGFNTVDIGVIAIPTMFVCVVWFFIGSAPGSTGGGVRVTTATVVVMAVRAMLRGRDDVELFGRTLPKSIVYRSISIVLIAGLLCATFLVMTTASQEHLPLDKLIFETISAFGTVGLSMGVTSELDTSGRWLMTVLMYFGRVGPLTLALAVGERVGTRRYRYPEGRLAVG
jgi:trk system potassium uptake protein TrkH